MLNQYQVKVQYISTYQHIYKNWESIFDKNQISKYQYYYGEIIQLGQSLRKFQLQDKVFIFLPFNHNEVFELKTQIIYVEDKYMIKSQIENENEIQKTLVALSYAFKLYNGLYLKGQYQTDNYVLVIGASKVFSSLILQIVKNSFIISNNIQELNFLQKLGKGFIFQNNDNQEIQTQTVNQGVDIILDFQQSHDYKQKQEILNLLSINGKWVLFNDSNIQLDPFESNILFYKNANLQFAFTDHQQVYGFDQGKALNIIHNFLNQIQNLDIQINRVFRYDEYEKLDQQYLCQNSIIEFKKKN